MSAKSVSDLVRDLRVRRQVSRDLRARAGELDVLARQFNEAGAHISAAKHRRLAFVARMAAEGEEVDAAPPGVHVDPEEVDAALAEIRHVLAAR